MTEPGRWQLAKEDPRLASGWMFGVDIERRTFFIASLVFITGLVLCFLVELPSILLYPIFGAFSVAVLRQRARKQAQLAEVPEHVDGVPSVAVKLTVRDSFHGPKLGEDQGWLTTSDGWLIYEGQRTRIALKPNDLESLQPRRRLCLRNGQEIHFQLLPLPLNEGQQISLGGLIDSWRDSGDPSGTSIYPPSDRHPETVAIPLPRILIATGVGVFFGALLAYFYPFLWAVLIVGLVFAVLRFRYHLRLLREAMHLLSHPVLGSGTAELP